MARKIILKDNGLDGIGDTPSGYKYIGDSNGDISEKVGATISSIGGNSETFKTTLNQATVRTLNSANSGYGVELLPPPGVGKAYLISNPIYKWVVTGGSFTSADLWLYYKNEGAATFLSIIIENPELIIPATFLEVPYNNNVTGAAEGLYPSDNIGINLYASVEQSSFEGSLIVTFDYKIVDFN